MDLNDTVLRYRPPCPPVSLREKGVDLNALEYMEKVRDQEVSLREKGVDLNMLSLRLFWLSIRLPS